MGMSTGAKGQNSEINVTPMIDVLLVLIIIFMVITPITPRGLPALLPQSAPETTPPDPPQHDIVITVLADRQVSLNQEVMNLGRLEDRLTGLFKTRTTKVVFIRGDKGLEFGEVAEVMDVAKGAGVVRIGLMTR
jgi:biopolymer transport protein TolR